MKKLKKIFYIIIFILILLFILDSRNLFASSNHLFQNVQYSDNFQKWLDLNDDEKNISLFPKMYNTLNTNVASRSPLYLARMLRSNITSSYSLKDTIPTNLYLRNQKSTNLCWAIASLSSLETNMALYNKRRGINTSLVYNYSERHMEYSTSKTFANNEDNPIGYNRSVGDGGNWFVAQSYLTNGSGAIDETLMPFENNENIIDISNIYNKTVSSQIYDTIDFVDYLYEDEDTKTEVINQIKQHIQNYGSVYASMHSNYSPFYTECYNNSTGAHYCSDSSSHLINHAISIIGWDDNYSISNFSSEAQPLNKGAWIVQNSWGDTVEYTLSQFKQILYNTYTDLCVSKGYTTYSLIPNEYIEELGFTIDNDIVYSNVGNNGIIYISYEDCNISSTLFGIVKSRDYTNYENIYQYDKYYPATEMSFSNSTVMLYNVFSKKTSEKEYLTQVSLYSPETYTCKVYVNPNGTSVSKDDLTSVSLKAGDTETINHGYHTLEFSTPIEITGDSFIVLIEIQGTRTNTINFCMESPVSGLSLFDNVTVESEKCFFAGGNNLDSCYWYDLGKLSEVDSSLPNGDSTLKAFTTSEVLDESIKNIEIITPPKKLSYIEGDDFDKTGMVVRVNFNNNTSGILDSTNYNITNGSNLQYGQTSVTISYEGKTAEQSITVEKNTVESLRIVTPPNITEYIEGQDFDDTGMIVEAVYKNKDAIIISDYIIENGENLKINQSSVTITYNGKSIEQNITVAESNIAELKIVTPPNITEYIEGQDFDDTGIIVVAIYKDGTSKNITDYIIENGENLNINQTSITIYFEGKFIEQKITVHPNEIIEIQINSAPYKTEYIVGQDFNNEGMIVCCLYANGDIQPITDYEITDGNNLTKNQQYVTISYKNKTVTQEISVIEKNIAEISIYQKPSKLSYIQNEENLDLTNGILKIYYNDGTSENINMTSNEISISGFDNSKLGKITINIIYQDKIARLEINIIENPKETPYNSVLENATCNVLQIEAYYFTNNQKDDYTLIDIELNSITRNLNNDTIRYYYYISSVEDEKNIMNWIEITEIQNSNDKLTFTINSKDIANYDEISTEQVLYLYVKEVAIKGGNQSISIVGSLPVESNVKIETYIDNIKGESFQSGNSTFEDIEDNTIAPDVIPQTGIQMTIVILFIIMLCIGIIIYIRYKIICKSMK